MRRTSVPPLSRRLRNGRYALLDRTTMQRYLTQRAARWFPGRHLRSFSIRNRSTHPYKMSIEYRLALALPGESLRTVRVRCSVPSVHTTFEGRNAFRVMRTLWRHHATLPAPRPLAYDHRLRALFYEAAEGVPLERFLRLRAPTSLELLRDAGGWLATLHRLRLPGGRRRTGADERREAVYFTMNIGRLYPNGLPVFERLLAAFFTHRNRLQRRIARAATLVHGDFNPKNILVRRDGTLTVIDFGNARRYDPMHDLANAVVQLGYVPMVTPRYLGAAERALLAGYTAGRPLSASEEHRFAVFQLWWALQTLAYTATLPLTTKRNFEPVLARTVRMARRALRILRTP